MRLRISRPAAVLLILVMVVANLIIAVFLLQPLPERGLTVSFLNVGQGDAILIESPTGMQMLIDGGKDRSVLRELPKVMGPLDRSIDVVVATHPDADHIGGLPDVFGQYRISWLLLSGRLAESGIANNFAYAAENERNLSFLQVSPGMRLHLGGGAYADVLHPEGAIDKMRSTNDSSIVVRVVYGNTAFMFTGDAAEWVEERLVKEYGEELKSTVLKAGHHGSKTSTGKGFLAVVQPETVVISAGKGNSYGHPHTVVLENIRESGAKTLSTAEEGTIVLRSDGSRVVQI